ncbi:MAG TPA: gliding motility lipoprotein GldH [Cyclobacteriaceae bacterium]|nr:gliding motility lipoprotein GldH [Cyclobacteriaceae bacterium]
MKGRNKLLLWTAALASVWACNSDRVFEEHQGMEALLWAAEDTVTFETGPLELNNSVSLLNVRYNESYEFHNIYIRYLLKDSLDNLLTDSLINVSLFDNKTGRPLGDGFGNVFTKQDTLPQIPALSPQKLKVQFIQYMRKEELEGIEAVGLKINRQ